MDARRWDKLWLLTWASLSSLWCLTAGQQLSATFDEPLYVEASLRCWRESTNQPLIRWGTMPLPGRLQALPAYLIERFGGFSWDTSVDFPTLLTLARLANLPFWWLLLYFGGQIGNCLAGCWGGRLAIASLACEPSLLAHAGLATTDIAATACLLGFAHVFYLGRTAGWRWRIGGPSVAYAIALGAKASALAFGPLTMLAIGIWGYAQRGDVSRWDYTRRFLLDALQIAAIGLALLVVACGSDFKPEPSFIAWAQKLPPGSTGDNMRWLAENLRIFSNAAEGIVRQIKHNLHGHGTYLLGESSPRRIWYYFPVLLSMKLPVPILLAPLAMLVRPRTLWGWPTIAVLLMLAFSLNCRVQIGIRLQFPLVALWMIGVAVGLARCAESVRWPAVVWAPTAGGLLWLAGSSVAQWPDGLDYINELWGGPAQGHRLVSDSNFDWGQGLLELERWQCEQNLQCLDVWYFGTDPRVFGVGQFLPLHTLPPLDPAGYQQFLKGRILAVSPSIIYGYAETPAHQAAAGFLKAREPAGRVGLFFIYDFR